MENYKVPEVDDEENGGWEKRYVCYDVYLGFTSGSFIK